MVSKNIRIIIADDHRMVRKAWQLLLSEQEGIEVVGQAANGQELLNILQSVKTDLVLMDLDMPIMNGMEATTKIKNRFPWIRIIVLTMQKDYAYIEQLFSQGASAFLTKNASEDELFMAVSEVANGGRYLSKEIGDVLSSRLMRGDQTKENLQYDDLTSREIEIIKLIQGGLTTSQIAEKLFLSIKTVESHRRNIFRKTGVKNVVQLLNVVKSRII